MFPDDMICAKVILTPTRMAATLKIRERSVALSEKHLAKAISKRFREMSGAERRRKIAKLAGRSAADEKFIRHNFPELYRELTPRSSRRVRRGEQPRVARQAKSVRGGKS